MGTRLGKQTIRLDTKPVIQSWASIVGAKEGHGPLGRFFDEIIEDEYFGEKALKRLRAGFSERRWLKH